MTRTVYLMAGMTLAAQLTLAAAQHPRPDFERTQWPYENNREVDTYTLPCDLSGVPGGVANT